MQELQELSLSHLSERSLGWRRLEMWSM